MFATCVRLLLLRCDRVVVRGAAEQNSNATLALKSLNVRCCALLVNCLFMNSNTNSNTIVDCYKKLRTSFRILIKQCSIFFMLCNKRRTTFSFKLFVVCLFINCCHILVKMSTIKKII